jgi:hypothetical protein
VHVIAYHYSAPPFCANAFLAEMARRAVPLAKPYSWPFNGAFRPDDTAVIVIDMQVPRALLAHVVAPASASAWDSSVPP